MQLLKIDYELETDYTEEVFTKVKELISQNPLFQKVIDVVKYDGNVYVTGEFEIRPMHIWDSSKMLAITKEMYNTVLSPVEYLTTYLNDNCEVEEI